MAIATSGPIAAASRLRSATTYKIAAGRRGEPVFEEVTLPSGFDYALADGSMRPIADWGQRGVRRIDGVAWIKPISRRSSSCQPGVMAQR